MNGICFVYGIISQFQGRSAHHLWNNKYSKPFTKNIWMKILKNLSFIAFIELIMKTVH